MGLEIKLTKEQMEEGLRSGVIADSGECLDTLEDDGTIDIYQVAMVSQKLGIPLKDMKLTCHGIRIKLGR